jgi:hypothetical protein
MNDAILYNGIIIMASCKLELYIRALYTIKICIMILCKLTQGILSIYKVIIN